LPARKKAKTAASDKPPATGVEALDALFQTVNRGDAPGLVVGVAQHGKTVFRRGYGMASMEHAVANTPATRMRIGSVTKHFTCLAVLLLAEDGKLDVDAPASTYLPELPPLRGMPTLRQFMTHTSGYRCYLDLAGTAAGLAMQPPGRALQTQFKQADANFAPGESQLYCNGGYHLLSVIVDRVSGMPLEQFLQERIFKPLGMRDTAGVQSDMTILPGMATLHAPQPGRGAVRWRRGIFVTEEVRGEGGMVSTVDDMLTWLAHLRGPSHRVGNEDTWRQMTTTAVLDNGLATPYALGLFRHDYRGLETIYHHGVVLGGMCQMLTVPAHELDIIVITNGPVINHIEVTRRIIDTMLPEHVQGDASPRMAGIRRFKHLAGTAYRDDDGLVFGFDAVGDKLGISYLYSKALPALRDEGQHLRIRYEDVGLGPFELKVSDLRPGPDGSPPKTLPVSDCGLVRLCRRLPARQPATAKAGVPLLGRFRCDDLDADGTIAFEGRELTLRLRGGWGTRHIVLEAAASDCFKMTWRDELDPATSALVLTQESGQVTGFKFNTLRSRHLHFVRVAA
jgi:D-aminopeptidase